MTRIAPFDPTRALDRVWAALAGCPAPVAVAGPDGRILRANPAMGSLLGRSDDPGSALRIGQLVHPDDLPEGERGQDAVARPLAPGRRELRWVRRDGSVVACLTSVWLATDEPGGNAYTDDRGCPLLTIHQLEDLSERERLSSRLDEAEAEFQQLVQSISEYAIYHLDPDGRVCSWNPGAERIKGYRSEEIIGRHYRICFLPEDVASGVPDANLERADREGHISGEGWRRRKDGSHFWAAWTLSAIRHDGQLVGYAKVTRDLSEQRAAAARIGQYAADLEHAVHDLEEANRFQEDLLNVANHEFRTPLTALLGFSETLRTAWESLDPEERSAALAAMATASHRLIGLVDNLVALSSLRSGVRSLSLEPVRVVPAVHDAAAQSGIDIKAAQVNVPEDLAVQADPARLRQILGNLLSNADIYGGGVVEVTARPVESSVVIEVADEGPGVSEDFVGRLFDRFSQASRGITRTARGTGLGLAAVRELARAQDGDAHYVANEPRGARFVVVLPAA